MLFALFCLLLELLGTRASLLGARTLLVAPGLTTRNEKLHEATSNQGHRYMVPLKFLTSQAVPRSNGASDAP